MLQLLKAREVTSVTAAAQRVRDRALGASEESKDKEIRTKLHRQARPLASSREVLSRFQAYDQDSFAPFRSQPPFKSGDVVVDIDVWADACTNASDGAGTHSARGHPPVFAQDPQCNLPFLLDSIAGGVRAFERRTHYNSTRRSPAGT